MLVRRGSAIIGPDRDLRIELPEKSETSLCNLELANEVPCDKRIQ